MVAKVANIADHNPEIREMQTTFEAQKAAFRAHPMPSAEERINQIKRLKPALIRHQENFVDAVNKDFGSRCPTETKFVELVSLLETIKYCSGNVAKWMRPERRKVPMNLKPASAKVVYQPLGVVGIIVPWNYPIFLAIDPLIGALAAGNRVMIKMSEFTPHTAQAVKNMLSELYSEDQVAVFCGETDVSVAFSKLPFDHLLFTGSTAVGKHIMAAAAENLTPVTLELGGKSPILIHESFPMKDAAERLSWGKCVNAGQTCVAPDYALVHRSKLDEFQSELEKVFGTWYPNARDNEDYTAVINERQLNRLKGYLKDAEDKGARIVPLNPEGANYEGSGKLPVTLVFDTTEDMEIEKNEIFGPLLIVKPYDRLEEAVQYINDRPRPLALYYFDYDNGRVEYVLNNTHSGGVTVNDTLTHVVVEDIPFGGVGPSGMGQYHGPEGFKTFSKAKGVAVKGKVNAARFFYPPWNRRIHKMLLNTLLKQKD